MRRALTLALLLATPALALDSPWISDTYFYWYQWDYARQWGGWEGGVYNTPLGGYYDSARFDDNLHQLHTASEWGVSHHFMDYWGPGWKGEGGEPREMTLVRATEALRARGYPIFMGAYQDGTDFDMADFVKNVQPGRDAFFYLDLFGRHDSYPKLKGQPVALIYGRNGFPKITAKDEGFRDYLQARYGDIGKLNRQWGSSYPSFDGIRLDFGSGFARYESIQYQYELWQLAWDQVGSVARERWHQPGVLCSWDVGFQPYQGWGFSDMCRVFVGTHSYGGIFDVPHSEGVERFIQAQVAKAYDTVFFDTYKNYYHDWEIRIPGICYPPDFNAFDRFWMQVLLNKSEALLHLSWNEWWEGSNLEPSLEYGKTYCEKNLLWASVLQQCFPSVHNWNRGARVAVLLNDWNWYVGGTHTADIYGTVQALRRSGVTFDLLPDDFVDARALGRFDTVIAPTAGVGLGFNLQGQAILPLLRAWVEGKAGRKFVLSQLPDIDPASKLNVDAWLGLRPLQAAGGATRPGADMNVVVDVGTEGDEKFLVAGMSQREDWGKLPADSFGAQTGKHTVRWCPAAGKRTTFLLPFAAHRDHVLRFGGDALQGQTVTVVIDDQPVGTVAIKPGYNEYELAIPAGQVGGLEFAALHLQWEKAIIPSEIDPKTYPSENRVTNLAIEFLQLATAGTAKNAPVRFKLPESKLTLTAEFPGALKGRDLPADYTPHRAVQAGKVLSRYAADQAARDLLLSAGKGQVWYCNGFLGTVPEPRYFDAILDWSGAKRDVRVEGAGVLGGTVSAGDTTVVLAYNNDAPEKRTVSITRAARDLPVSEVQVLSLDGNALPQIYPGQPGKRSDVKMTVPMAYYAALEVAYAPVRVDAGRSAACWGWAGTCQASRARRCSSR
ncbi:MAG: hypothetical protein HYU66_27685 [Armatimonadetes bacterium]|nr:hypothetical protein [Armatimonadota bacterium]